MSGNREDHITLVNRPRDHKKMQRKSQLVAEQMRKNKELKEQREKAKQNDLESVATAEEETCSSSVEPSAVKDVSGIDADVKQKGKNVSIHQPD